MLSTSSSFTINYFPEILESSYFILETTDSSGAGCTFILNRPVACDIYLNIAYIDSNRYPHPVHYAFFHCCRYLALVFVIDISGLPFPARENRLIFWFFSGFIEHICRNAWLARTYLSQQKIIQCTTPCNCEFNYFISTQ